MIFPQSCHLFPYFRSSKLSTKGSYHLECALDVRSSPVLFLSFSRHVLPLPLLFIWAMILASIFKVVWLFLNHFTIAGGWTLTNYNLFGIWYPKQQKKKTLHNRNVWVSVPEDFSLLIRIKPGVPMIKTKYFILALMPLHIIKDFKYIIRYFLKYIIRYFLKYIIRYFLK